MDDATLARLSSALDDPARRDAAWTELGRALSADPGRVAPLVCERLAAWLDGDASSPLVESALLALENATRVHPALVGEGLPRRVLAVGDRVHWAGVIAAGAMLVRLRPEAILTEGLEHVLVATEHALCEHDETAPVLRHVHALAVDLWGNVARGDPASIVAILELWAARVGWHRRSVRLLADLLLEHVPRDLGLLEESVGVLRTICAEAAADDTDQATAAESPDEHLHELEGRRDALRRKVLAEQIVGAIDTAALFEPPPELCSPPAPTVEPPDPRVDRLLERFLSGRSWRQRMEDAEQRMVAAVSAGDLSGLTDDELSLLGSSEAPEEQLARALSRPWPALVAGVCDLVDELVEEDPRDPRVRTLLLQLWLAFSRRPELTPAEVIQGWVTRPEAFDDEMRAHLYDSLAAVRPEWVIVHAIRDAAGTDALVSASRLWSHLGKACPGLLLQFARGWLEHAPWHDETIAKISAAFEHAARVNPRQIPAMLDLLEPWLAPAPEPEVIDFRFAALSKIVGTLREMEGSRA